MLLAPQGTVRSGRTRPPYPTAGDLATDFPETSHASWSLTHFHSLGPTGEHASPARERRPFIRRRGCTSNDSQTSLPDETTLLGYTFGKKLLNGTTNRTWMGKGRDVTRAELLKALQQNRSMFGCPFVRILETYMVEF